MKRKIQTKEKKISFVFTTICTVIVLVVGGLLLFLGFTTISTIWMIIGVIFLALGILGFIEKKKNKGIARSLDLEHRAEISHFD